MVLPLVASAALLAAITIAPSQAAPGVDLDPRGSASPFYVLSAQAGSNTDVHQDPADPVAEAFHTAPTAEGVETYEAIVNVPDGVVRGRAYRVGGVPPAGPSVSAKLQNEIRLAPPITGPVEVVIGFRLGASSAAGIGPATAAVFARNASGFCVVRIYRSQSVFRYCEGEGLTSDANGIRIAVPDEALGTPIDLEVSVEVGSRSDGSPENVGIAAASAVVWVAVTGADHAFASDAPLPAPEPDALAGGITASLAVAAAARRRRRRPDPLSEPGPGDTLRRPCAP